MIKDKLANASQYMKLSPLLREAFAAVANTDWAHTPYGKIPVKGEDCWINYSLSPLKDWEDARWEAHDKYLDIQIVLKGCELMEVSDRALLTPADAYNPEKDVQHFTGEGDLLTLRRGDFAILWPGDGHRPLIRPSDAAEDAANIKLVVKLRAAAL